MLLSSRKRYNYGITNRVACEVDEATGTVMVPLLQHSVVPMSLPYAWQG